MADWYRVFTHSAEPISRSALLSCVAATGLTFAAEFDSDAEVWLRADVELSGVGSLSIERFSVEEPGIRAELNSWAAHVEELEPAQDVALVMERIIQTRQLVTLRMESDDRGEVVRTICVAMTKLLAGIWQSDRVGFCDEAGRLLVRERDSP